MARKIKEIYELMSAELTAAHPSLSTSATAEWKLFLWVIATAIHTFEVILTMFRKEIDSVADKITPGTPRWYINQCKRWQNGHEIKFNEVTAELFYEHDAPSDRIIKVVAVSEQPKTLSIKVAKLNNENKIIPLSDDEKYNFIGYIDSIKFAGIETNIVTANADLIRYDIDVYYEPSMPSTIVETEVRSALDKFRSALSFDSKFYKQRITDCIMAVRGVVTVEMVTVSRKGGVMIDFQPCGVADELHSGYFDYDTDNCNLTLISISKVGEEKR